MLKVVSGNRLYWVGGIAFAIIAYIAVFLEMPVWILPVVPLALGLVYLTIEDFKWVFFILIACIPLSIEYSFPGGPATDLPTEPIMIWLSGVTVLYIAMHPGVLSRRFLLHPLSLLIYAHLFWMFVTTFYSDMPVVSWKFLLAKAWYFITFFFLPAIVLKERKNFKRLILFLAVPMVLVAIVVFIRHGMHDFAFAEINYVLGPTFRNHVNYSFVIAFAFIFLGYIFWNRRSKGKSTTWLGIVLLFLLAAVYFSYTRAAMVGLVLCIPAALIIHFRWMRYALTVILISVMLGATWILNDARYLKYAPNYEQTIAHKEFDNLISATYQGEDISTMERLHRWVAGYHMTMEDPFLGFGPGTFYFFYKGYTLNMFKTYVSHNPQQSGIHNYYLMTLVEQGWPGAVLFLALVCYALILGERIYHNAQTKEQKARVLTISSILVFILAVLIINDMVETDKVGSFFWLSLSLLVLMDIETQSVSSISNQGSR